MDDFWKISERSLDPHPPAPFLRKMLPFFQKFMTQSAVFNAKKLQRNFLDPPPTSEIFQKIIHFGIVRLPLLAAELSKYNALLHCNIMQYMDCSICAFKH